MPSQNKTNIKWSNEQLKFAELLIDPEDRRTRREKIAEVGVSPSTAYRWLKDPEYLDYINNQLDIVTHGHLTTAWSSLITQVKRGDTQAIKLFFELIGKYKDRKEITGKDGEPVKFQNMSDEKLLEEAEKYGIEVE